MDALARINQAVELMHRQRFVEAVDELETAVAALPDQFEAHVNLAFALLKVDRVEDAIAHGRRAVTLRPDAAPAHNSLGNALAARGDLEAASTAWNAAFGADPTHPGTLANLTALARDGGFALPEGVPERMAELFARPELADNDRARVGFALAAWHDAGGRYETAFEHAARANELQARVFAARGRRFDPDAFVATVSTLMEAFPAARIATLQAWGSDSGKPLFVVGMPRSGTTLVERILAARPGVASAGELRDVSDLAAALGEPTGQPYPASVAALTRDDCERFTAAYLERLDGFDAGAARVVDKMPENYLHLGLVAALFPRARIVHCRRDALDTCQSCFFQNFGAVPWANRLDDLACVFLQYRRLMRHWSSVLPAPPVEVDYESLVAAPEDGARRLLRQAGLDHEAAGEPHRGGGTVRTASRFQVRRPVYAHAAGRWRHYAAQLEPLRRRLEGG